MRVIVTDRRFSDRDPYRDAVEAAGGELVYADLQTEDEVVEACRDATVVVTFKAPITRTVIEAMESCQLIVRNGTGWDNVDVPIATEHGIPVTNIPDYCTEEVASHAIALMFGAAHQVVLSDRSLREADGWGPRRPINPMFDGTFATVGFGRIGRAATRFAAGLGMDVIAYDPYVPDDIFESVGAERTDFNELLERADCISLHTPLTAETHHMISTEQLAKMKSDAVLVNTARGPLIDEDALVAAVESDEIFAAGLDVFEVEPPRDTPIFETDRIIVSPHHAGITEMVERRCIEIGCDKIQRALRGEHLGEIINPEAYGTANELSPERTYWERTE